MRRILFVSILLSIVHAQALAQEAAANDTPAPALPPGIRPTGVAPAEGLPPGVTPRPVGTYDGVTPGQGNPPPVVRPGRRPTLISWPGVQFAADGRSRFFVQTSSATPVESRLDGNRYVVRIKGVRVPLRTNRLPLETHFFNTPVQRAYVVARGRDAEVVFELRANVTPTTTSETAASGYHFVYVDFPSGSYAPAANSPLPSAPARRQAVDTSMDNERPPALSGQ